MPVYNFDLSKLKNLGIGFVGEGEAEDFLTAVNKAIDMLLEQVVDAPKDVLLLIEELSAESSYVLTDIFRALRLRLPRARVIEFLSSSDFALSRSCMRSRVVIIGFSREGPNNLKNEIFIVWNPAEVAPQQYADVIAALGDLARKEGALGVERQERQGFLEPRPVIGRR